LEIITVFCEMEKEKPTDDGKNADSLPEITFIILECNP
jgi:hypothetical protein